MGLDLDDYAGETSGQLVADEDICECLPRSSREGGLHKIEDGKRRLFEERLGVVQNRK